MQQFIFGGDNMPKTPQELARLRAVAQAMAPDRTPQNVGEGIDSIGKAILYRSMIGKADKAENAGIASANDAWSSLFSNPEDPASVDPTAAVPPVDTSAVTPSIASPQDAVDASPQKPLTGDLAQTEAYIRNAAQKRGIDPDYAVKVARSEGLAPGVWQSRVKKGDMFEPSFGPFQMLVGDGKNFPKGMGNDFQERTGLDPRDPKNTNAMIDFALDTAKKDGWRQWYGAKKVGVNRWDGINANQVASLDANVPASAMVDPAQEQVPVVPVPDGFQQPDPIAAQQQVQQPVEVADNSNAIQPRKKVAQALSRLDPQKAYEVLNNPYLPEGRKETIRALLRQQFEAENMAREQELKQADPKYQLELEKGKLELGTLKNPPKARTLTDDEEKALNLPIDGVYQEKPDGSISTIREPGKAIDAVNAEKAQIELENLKSPKGKWNKLNDTTIVNDVTGETKTLETGGKANFRFPGNSTEAAALNGLIETGQLTIQQAQQIAAGKSITGPNGEILFATPEALIGANQQRQAQQDGGIDIFAGEQPQAIPAEKPADAVPAVNQRTDGMIPLTQPKTTLDERKAMTFADRMVQSGSIIDEMGATGAGRDESFVNEWAPFGLGSLYTSDSFKKMDQAKRDFINAQLRRESGATIQDQEFDNANKQYFPQPGDPPEVIEQKRKNRQTVIEGMVRDSGPTYKRPKAELPTGADEKLPPKPDDVTDLEWKNMSPEDRKLWQN